MRETKFRALNAQGIFVYGALIQRNYDGNKQLYVYDVKADETEIHEYAGGAGGKWSLKDCFIPVQLGTEGEYTGLKDRHGVEIYEGDILNGVYGYSDAPIEVRWNLNGWGLRVTRDCYEPHTGVRWVSEGQWVKWPTHIDLAEVIGNIWENPELAQPAQGTDKGEKE